MAPGTPATLPPLRPARQADLLVAVCRGRTVVASGVVAGVGVFLAPIIVLAFALLAAYLGYLAGDAASVLAVGRPIEATDFRAVFAPVITESPILVCAGLAGGLLAAYRRRLASRAGPEALVMGTRRLLPEYVLLYVLLVVLTIGLAAVRGGPPRLWRLWSAAPFYLVFLVIGTGFAHTIWQYCFRNVLDLLATDEERAAASDLRSRVRLPRLRPRSW